MLRALISLPLVVAICVTFFSNAGAQDDPAVQQTLNVSGPPRKQDAVYLINTRQVAKADNDEALWAGMQRWSEADAWEPLSLDALLSDGADEATTVIYVHGYGFDEQKAERAGWGLYHALCGDLPVQQRVRYFIWSWPTTEKRFRPTRDFAEKSGRADTDAILLARFLEKFPPTANVCVIGSALGCHVVQGAMHHWGTSKLQRSQQSQKRAGRLSAVLIAAAVHDDWLYPGNTHGNAVSATDRLLLINNSVDPALPRYSRVWRTHPRALGLDGLQDLSKFGEHAERIQQYDAHEEILENHGIEHYVGSPAIVKRLQSFVFDQ